MDVIKAKLTPNTIGEREEIDYFAVYCEHTEKVYLVPVEDINGADVRFV